jgi:ribosome-associated toxin RatA of RatAB toxin-antitoxin module
MHTNSGVAADVVFTGWKTIHWHNIYQNECSQINKNNMVSSLIFKLSPFPFQNVTFKYCEIKFKLSHTFCSRVSTFVMQLRFKHLSRGTLGQSPLLSDPCIRTFSIDATSALPSSSATATST